MADPIPSSKTKRTRRRTADVPTIEGLPIRTLRDMREFPLGFFDIVPGQKPLSRKEARRQIRVYKKQLFKYLTGETTKRPSPPIMPGVGAIDIVSRPQICFRGERLVIPSTIAQHFSIIDIKVGNRSQLANSTALPAMTFCENAIGVRLALDTAVVAQDIALVVENDSRDEQTFTAALIGTAIQ